LTWETLGLVDLGQEGVGGLRDNGGGHTSDQTGCKVERSVLSRAERVFGFASGSEDVLYGDFVANSKLACSGQPRTVNSHGEFSHGVWNLFEQDGTESNSRSAYNSLVLFFFIQTYPA
jgi:hypothetical protein